MTYDVVSKSRVLEAAVSLASGRTESQAGHLKSQRNIYTSDQYHVVTTVAQLGLVHPSWVHTLVQQRNDRVVLRDRVHWHR